VDGRTFVTDSLRIDLDHSITFHTLAGEIIPAHGVALVLTGDGKSVAPGARVVFRVAFGTYQRILAESLFGLVPAVRGEPASPFVDDREVELDAELRPELAVTLIARGGGARDVVSALGGGSGFEFLATTESWLTQSVVQELDPPAGAAPDAAVKSGFRVRSPS
jgi:hypothetical protein